jgi:uncharacterized protein YjbJ (UPF0337 family)
MKLSTRYQAKGMFHIVRGTVKNISGKITSNTTLGVRGKIERLTGKVQCKISKTQRVFGF